MTELELRNRIALEAGVLTNPYWQGKRITNKINEAQRWLQQKLIKQGFKNWKRYANINLTGGTVFGITDVYSGTLPTDRLIDLPIESVRTNSTIEPPTTSGYATEKPQDKVVDIIGNPVIAPSFIDPIFWLMNETIYIYPIESGEDVAEIAYTKNVADLVYDNDSTQSEIPNSHIEIVIERCVMQIKSSLGDENVKQAKLNEIDKQLSIKYQLDRAVSVTDEKGYTGV